MFILNSDFIRSSVSQKARERIHWVSDNKQGWTHLWFLVIRVGNLLPLIPIRRLFRFRILYLFRGQEVPILFQRSRFYFLIVNLDFISVVRIDD